MIIIAFDRSCAQSNDKMFLQEQVTNPVPLVAAHKKRIVTCPLNRFRWKTDISYEIEYNIER